MPHAICPMLQMMMLSDAVCKERKIPGGEVKYQTVLRTGKWFLDVYKPNKKIMILTCTWNLVSKFIIRASLRLGKKNILVSQQALPKNELFPYVIKNKIPVSHVIPVFLILAFETKD